MTFQYFFFNTYPGYFLQMVPLALAVGIVSGLWKYRRGVGKGRSICIGLLQPIFGRAFDVNDVILNLTGIVVSTAVFRMIHK